MSGADTHVADLAVVGLGVAGAMTAWRASVAGLDVVGLDQAEPGHARGASHGGTRIVRRLGWEGPQRARTAAASFDLFGRLAAEAGVRLVRPVPGVVAGRAGGEFVAGVLATARACGVAHDVLDAAAASRRFPQLRLDADEVAVVEESAGVADPEACVRAAAAAARARGARLLTGAATHLEATRSGWAVLDGDRVLARARRVLLATGAWLESVPHDGPTIQARRVALAWFAPAPGAPAELLAAPTMPVFVHDGPQGRFWGIPDVTPDGSDGVKVGGSSAPMPHPPSVNADVPVAAGEVAAVEGFVASRLPLLAARVARAAPCMDGYTPGGEFVLAAVKAAPGVGVLGGLSGHGFKHAPALGEAAAAWRGPTQEPQQGSVVALAAAAAVGHRGGRHGS